MMHFASPSTFLGVVTQIVTMMRSITSAVNGTSGDPPDQYTPVPVLVSVEGTSISTFELGAREKMGHKSQIWHVSSPKEFG